MGDSVAWERDATGRAKGQGMKDENGEGVRCALADYVRPKT